MRTPAQNLASPSHAVNPPSGPWLKASICTFVRLTSQNMAKRRRAPYIRRLQLLAAGNPRAMNFATSWCIALHSLSELPAVGTSQRDGMRTSWREMHRAAGFVVSEIQAGARRG